MKANASLQNLKPFQKGGPGGPGRPKGSRNVLAESFLDVLYRDWQANGVQAVAAAREESPLGYVKVIAGLLPQKLEIEKAAAAVTDDELVEIIRRGAEKRMLPEALPPKPNVEAEGRA